MEICSTQSEYVTILVCCIVCCRRFPTVERRAGLCCGQLYHALPSDRELCREVMASCQLSLPEVWLPH